MNRYGEPLCAACRAYPDCAESEPWGPGETAFQVRGHNFAFVTYGMEPVRVTAKPDPGERDGFLQLAGVRPAPYVGRFGWLQVVVTDDATLERAQVLIGQSYAQFAGGRRRRPLKRRDAEP